MEGLSWQAQLDLLIKTAFESFSNIQPVSQWVCEKDIVSWFVIDHLLPLIKEGSIIREKNQIGIEMAVPQERAEKNEKKKNPFVNKDVVIWEKAGMSCWNADGVPNVYPISVIEWKLLNKRNQPHEKRKKTRVLLDYDIPWLQRTAAKLEKFIGYGVLVDVTNKEIEMSCIRVTEEGKKATKEVFFQTPKYPSI